MDVCNFVEIGPGVWAGDKYDWSVWVAKVDPETERFKYATWEKATPDQERVYYAKRMENLEWTRRCPETNELWCYCTCGWH